MTAKMYVYRNLHKPGHFSVTQYGKVVMHTTHAYFNRASCVIRPAGKRKAVIEQRRNVHAFIAVPPEDFFDLGPVKSNLDDLEEVTYNPFKHDTFVWKSDESPITELNYGVCYNGRVFAHRSES